MCRSQTRYYFGYLYVKTNINIKEEGHVVVVEEEIPEEVEEVEEAEPIEEPVEGEIQRHTHDCNLMYLHHRSIPTSHLTYFL